MDNRGYTLIELIVIMAVISIIGGMFAASISLYHRTKNSTDVMLTQNSILSIINNSKQKCREKGKEGYIQFDIPHNGINFVCDGICVEKINIPKEIKLEDINTVYKKININNKGFTSDACTITFRDYYNNLHKITICVGTAYAEIKY